MINKFKNKKLFVFLDQMLVSGSNFLLGVLLARYLGIEGYGQFALFWLIVLFFSSLQLAYIISPMLTLGAKKNDLILDRYLSTMISLQFFFTGLLMISLYLFFEIAQFFDEKWNVGDLKLYIILTTLLFLFQDFIRRYFIIKVQYFKLIVIDVIAYFGQILIISYLIYVDTLDLKSLFLALSLSFGFSFILGYIQIKKVKTTTLHKKLLFFKNWQFSKWLVYSAVLQWGSGNFFILAAGAILGSWAVGVIRVMQNTMGIFHVLFIALENILPINFSKIYKQNGYTSMMNYFKLQVKYGVITFSILASFIYLFSSDIIDFIYGKEYVEYAYLLIFFALNYFLLYMLLIYKVIARTMESTKRIFTTYTYAFLITLVVVYPIIKFFNINGVVFGILIINIVQLYFLNKIGRIKTHD